MLMVRGLVPVLVGLHVMVQGWEPLGVPVRESVRVGTRESDCVWVADRGEGVAEAEAEPEAEAEAEHERRPLGEGVTEEDLVQLVLALMLVEGLDVWEAVPVGVRDAGPVKLPVTVGLRLTDFVTDLEEVSVVLMDGEPVRVAVRLLDCVGEGVSEPLEDQVVEGEPVEGLMLPVRVEDQDRDSDPACVRVVEAVCDADSMQLQL
mmetsp:Transcript_26438/g.47627  ORF Transcript_26438/g.47627 Transcript_26438/m.47627 type:complete len:205 (+) Transcript_26438:759-1373(+)